MSNYREDRDNRPSRPMSGNTLRCIGSFSGKVTGSSMLFTVGVSRFMVDCGLHQGTKDNQTDQKGERPNFSALGPYLRGTTEVVFTHAHIDHTGRAPAIDKAGFSPTYIASKTTALFMAPLLHNSAKIQSNEKPDNQLYDSRNVENMLRRLKAVDTHTQVHIGEKHGKNTVELDDNGHVMGACSAFFRTDNKQHKQNILCTGDIGKPHQSLSGGYLDLPSPPTEPVHVLIAESTNYLREPTSFDTKKAHLVEAIKKGWQTGGAVIMPVLSFHRLQELIADVHELIGKELPADTHVDIDAPLGIELLKEFQGLTDGQLSSSYGYDKNHYKTLAESLDRFKLPHLKLITSHQDSVDNDSNVASTNGGHRIVFASGGMAQHGRIRVYLDGKSSENPNTTFLFTCHQVAGTPGAKLINYDKLIRSNKPGAKIDILPDFTSHGSGKEIINYLKRWNLGQLQMLIINHGNDESRVAMKQGFINDTGFDGPVLLARNGQEVLL